MFLDKMESDEAEEFGIENEESENCAYPPIPLKTKSFLTTFYFYHRNNKNKS